MILFVACFVSLLYFFIPFVFVTDDVDIFWFSFQQCVELISCPFISAVDCIVCRVRGGC